MRLSSVVAAPIPLVAASPMAVLEPRAQCPDVTAIGPTDAEASLCCVYGQSIAHCCRNKPFADDPYWSRALPCTSEWFTKGKFGYFYVCQVDPCDKDCKPMNIPYVFDGPVVCPQ